MNLMCSRHREELMQLFCESCLKTTVQSYFLFYVLQAKEKKICGLMTFLLNIFTLVPSYLFIQGTVASCNLQHYIQTTLSLSSRELYSVLSSLRRHFRNTYCPQRSTIFYYVSVICHSPNKSYVL